MHISLVSTVPVTKNTRRKTRRAGVLISNANKRSFAGGDGVSAQQYSDLTSNFLLLSSPCTWKM